MLWIVLGTASSALAILAAVLLALYVVRQDPGSGKMLEVAGAIKEGARAFLKVQSEYLLAFTAAMALAVLLILGVWPAVAYIAGAMSSLVAGIFGMEIAVRANVRTANAAYRNGMRKAFLISYFGGAVMGLSVVGFALLGIIVFFAIFRSFVVVLAFSLGASSVALFAKAGGGIFTKTADISADLVGKVVLGLPEDDPRNPAVIADNVGDNVGDVAGMASDLFDSYVASIVATMIIAFELYVEASGPEELIELPIVLASLGILSSLAGMVVVLAYKKEDPGTALSLSSLTASAIYAGLLLLLLTLGVNPAVVLSTLFGLLSGGLMGLAANYYTSIHRKPVREIAEVSQTGAALNILVGFSYGLLSAIPGVIGVAAAIMFSWYISSYFGLYELYGIAVAAIGMLGIVGTIVSNDAYGPIADNAKGIAEQSGLGEEVIKMLDELDAAGNTTKAVTKGFAIGAAALTVLALFASFAEIADLELLVGVSGIVEVDPSRILNLMNPNVVSGLMIGALMPAVFSALLILAVGENASLLISEIKRQIRENPGILRGEVKPDYARCVAIAEQGALKKLMTPGLIAVLSPILVGVLLGIRALAAFLAGSIMTGFIFALFMANAGGAWDNAKKLIEEGLFGGKGSEAHKAAVIGDTVGDPFKDTAGPSLNTMITVMSLVASAFSGAIMAVALFK